MQRKDTFDDLTYITRKLKPNFEPELSEIIVALVTEVRQLRERVQSLEGEVARYA